MNSSGLKITMTSNSTAVASPVTGYAIYGALPSTAGASYFCIDSTGNAKALSTGPAAVVNAGNAGTCQ
jgi:hypothetical protein